MKILIIGLVDYSKASGGAVHQLALVKGLSEAGHRVMAFAPRINEPSSIPEGLRNRFRFTPTGRRLRLPPFLDTLFQIPAVLWELLADRPDVIYLRSNTLTCILILIGRLFKVPVVSEHNTWQALERRYLGRSAWFAAIEERFQTLDARLSMACRAVTEGVKAILVSRGCDPSRIHVIGNGADTDRFRPMARAEALSAFGLDPALRYIGFIGSLTPWHGVHIAVEAMVRVVPHAADARLLIFGDGPERGRLEVLARDLGVADRVFLMGRVALEQSNVAINCFDVALAPFSKVLYGQIGVAAIKLGDYAAAQRYVIGSDLPGLRELAEGGWIDLVPPDDPEALAQAVLSATSKPEAILSRAAAALGDARTTMHWSGIVSRVADLLAEAKAKKMRS